MVYVPNAFKYVLIGTVLRSKRRKEEGRDREERRKEVKGK